MAKSAPPILDRFRCKGSVEPLTPVLLASALESDAAAMREIFHGTSYLLARATNWSGALNLIAHVAVPIILYDRHFELCEWQLGVRRLACSWRSPAVVLLSDVKEETLRDSLIISGGLEILVRPFESGAVLRTLAAALARK